MYHQAYGIIETLAPLHVGASAGEETGNLNLIFRDQFTQTGIIPGSSIRGRFRADMRDQIIRGVAKQEDLNKWYGREPQSKKSDQPSSEPENTDQQHAGDSSAASQVTSSAQDTTEAYAKFEYASLVWMPIFCPGQPVVWVTCPALLRRYRQITKIQNPVPEPYTGASKLQGRPVPGRGTFLFFNLGFLEITHSANLSAWIPSGVDLDANKLVVVDDNDMAMIHDMGLYRQSRVKLADDMKKVAGGAFFNVEALPEGSILVFPVALKEQGWSPFGNSERQPISKQDMYFGGLESIGFGRCSVTLGGEY